VSRLVSRVRPAGEFALLLECADLEAVWTVAAGLRAEPPPGLVEVVPGARTVLVLLDPDADPDGVAEELRHRSHDDAPRPRGRSHELPVVYDGEDLDEVARRTGRSEAEVVERHTAPEYTVAFLGFAPGFPYLLGLDPALHVPRRDTPRTRVPAGSVGLAGNQTGIYTTSTPGGWQLLGRTSATLFDPADEPPALLAPGDRVRFAARDAVDEPAPHRPVPLRRPTGRRATVLEPGGLLTVQDAGRAGHASLGVPRAGALDRDALRLADQLVGNRDSTAGLEAALPGGARLALRLEAGAAGAVAVVGGGAEVRLEGRPVPSDAALPWAPGSVLEVGPLRTGLRTWLGVAGGVDATAVLGSRSTDTLGQLGPPPLASGDVLPLGDPGEGVPAGRFLRRSDESPAVRVVLGPRSDALTEAGRELLLGTTWTVGAGDRVGVRLEGAALPLAGGESLPSEGMVTGSVQVPPDGQPVVLLAGAGTTGGYPVVAVVAGVDLGRLAALRHGDAVRLRTVEAAEARELRSARDRWLRRAVRGAHG
jgi:KipI family sensor histidine kinase inhibitor